MPVQKHAAPVSHRVHAVFNLEIYRFATSLTDFVTFSCFRFCCLFFSLRSFERREKTEYHVHSVSPYKELI